MSDKRERLQQHYEAAAHAVQSGVAMELNDDPASGTPKHLRVGVNMAMVEHGALVRVLIAKGLFTEVEYFEELVRGIEDEQRQYESRLSRRHGTTIKLA
jgi:sugar diacid utilization regulator